MGTFGLAFVHRDHFTPFNVTDRSSLGAVSATAAHAVAAGAVVSCFGALNGWILLQGQLPLAAAVDGLLPRVFARVSPRGTPVAGLVISSVLVTLVVATNYTRGLVNAFTFIILLLAGVPVYAGLARRRPAS